MKLKVFYTLIILLSLLTSCEKTTSFSYEMVNQSASTIYLNGTNIISNFPINDSISPGQSKEVAVWSKFGKQTELLNPQAIFGTSFVVTNTDGDTLQKDINSISNWNAVIDEARAVAIHKYSFEINEIDFN